MKEGSTPIRQQYLRIKRKYPQAIVFFRLGDFYETFDEDAKLTSKELEIDSLTPLEAITKLYELQKKAREE